MKDKVIVLIDANNLAYRNYFGVRGLKTKKGFPTNMIYGVLSSLKMIARRFKPDSTVVVWDARGKTVRHRYCEKLVKGGIYERPYKAGRKKTDEFKREFYPQQKILKAMLLLAGFKQYSGFRSEKGGLYEADDMINSLSKLYLQRYHGETGQVVLISSDEDYYQCLTSVDKSTKMQVVVARPSSGGDGFVMVDSLVFQKEWGIMPDQYVDVCALTGDSSDNIEGIPGIGVVTALKIVKEYPYIYPSLVKALKRGKTILTKSVTKKLIKSKHKIKHNLRLKTMADFSEEIQPIDRLLTRMAREYLNLRVLKHLFELYEIEAIQPSDLLECNRSLIFKR